MKHLGQQYLDIMAMPSGRRRRFVDENEHIDKWNAARQEAEAKTKKRGRR